MNNQVKQQLLSDFKKFEDHIASFYSEESPFHSEASCIEWYDNIFASIDSEEKAKLNQFTDHDDRREVLFAAASVRYQLVDQLRTEKYNSQSFLAYVFHKTLLYH